MSLMSASYPGYYNNPSISWRGNAGRVMTRVVTSREPSPQSPLPQQLQPQQQQQQSPPPTQPLPKVQQEVVVSPSHLQGAIPASVPTQRYSAPGYETTTTTFATRSASYTGPSSSSSAPASPITPTVPLDFSGQNVRLVNAGMANLSLGGPSATSVAMGEDQMMFTMAQQVPKKSSSMELNRSKSEELMNFASTTTTTSTTNIPNSPTWGTKKSASIGSSSNPVKRNASIDIEKEINGQNLYKTELCRSFVETGTCRYGSKCQFAHGKSELRPVLRHPKYKTEICKTFHTIGTCPYGTRCRFIHKKPETEIGDNSVFLSPALGIATTTNEWSIWKDEAAASSSIGNPTGSETESKKLSKSARERRKGSPIDATMGQIPQKMSSADLKAGKQARLNGRQRSNTDSPPTSFRTGKRVLIGQKVSFIKPPFFFKQMFNLNLNKQLTYANTNTTEIGNQFLAID